jgi:hypothetical protein
MKVFFCCLGFPANVCFVSCRRRHPKHGRGGPVRSPRATKDRFPSAGNAVFWRTQNGQLGACTKYTLWA